MVSGDKLRELCEHVYSYWVQTNSENDKALDSESLDIPITPWPSKSEEPWMQWSSTPSLDDTSKIYPHYLNDNKENTTCRDDTKETVHEATHIIVHKPKRTGSSETLHYPDVPAYIDETLKLSRVMKDPNDLYSCLESVQGCFERKRNDLGKIRLEHWKCKKQERLDSMFKKPLFPTTVYKARNKRTYKVVAMKWSKLFEKRAYVGKSREALYRDDESKRKDYLRAQETLYHDELMTVCREAYLLRKLCDSRFVIDLYDTIVATAVGGLKDNQRLNIFKVMEYCRGSDIKTFLELSNRCLSIGEIKAISASVLLGLQDLKEAGIVHRNICSENVLLSETGVAKLCDFEDAEIVLNEGRECGPSFNSRKDMVAPEIIHSGTVVDCQTDIWGFGILLIEMCIGRVDKLALGKVIKGLIFAELNPSHSDEVLINVLKVFPVLSRICKEYRQIIPILKVCLYYDRKDRPTVESLCQHDFFREEVQALRTLSAHNFKCINHKERKQNSKRFSFSKKKFVGDECACNTTLVIVQKLVAEFVQASKRLEKSEKCLLCTMHGTEITELPEQREYLFGGKEDRPYNLLSATDSYRIRKSVTDRRDYCFPLRPSYEEKGKRIQDYTDDDPEYLDTFDDEDEDYTIFKLF